MILKKSKVFRKLKGLFKKIGVFELLIGFIFLTVLAYIVLQTRSKEEWIKIEAKISSPSWWQLYYISPPFWLGDSIKIGDSEFDPRGKKIAEVLDIRVYELTDSGKGTEAVSRKDFYLTLNLQLTRDKRTGKIKFKNQPVEIGGPIELHLTNTAVTGLVTFIEGAAGSEETEELIIEGVWLNTFPWHAEAIKIGAEMKDGERRVVAEVLEKQVTLADMIVTTDNGQVFVGKNPLRRDVFIKAKILVKKQRDSYYFRKDQKVKIGENLFFHFSIVDVEYLSVTKIYDKEGGLLH